MDTTKLKKFAQFARRALIDQVDAKLEAVLVDSSPARRESADAVNKLEDEVKRRGRVQVVEQVAYIWFNRFCALRYMDVNGYTRVGIVSPTKEFTQPEILTEAKQGLIDEDLNVDRTAVRDLLNGTRPSRDPQQEAYRMLLVAACNFYNSLMPFMFEEIADYTELLMPDDLLSGNSVLTYTREALLPENCSPEHTEQSVEVIGWLYQFYISEKKDDVFAALKKGKKITPENIPAATQLFTPHWIVRYLVENSLGRLWMLNHPDSKLVERMDYYIKPEEPETDFLRIHSPEEIKICDPACGSGHMLTYAFDLLYAIYEEQGYQATEIPTLILTNNLFGIEIDQRAGALAAFALTMKAREKDRRFFTRKRPASDASPATSRSQLAAGPNICVLENIHFKGDELDDYIEQVGVNLFTNGLRAVLKQWEESDNFGSLIRPLTMDVSEVLELLRERQMGEDLFLSGVHQKVLKALKQADYLSPKYHVLAANPPYMGSTGMNAVLKAFLKEEYPDSKADLMTCFMEAATRLVKRHGLWGMINLPSWMFLNTFEVFRKRLVESQVLRSLLQLGRGIFGSDFGSVAFVCQNSLPTPQTTGNYRRLFEKHVDVRKSEEIRMLFLDDAYGTFRFQQSEFNAIPGAPIAYWVGESMRGIFKSSPTMGSRVDSKVGLQTSNNSRFLRRWFEPNLSNIGFSMPNSKAASDSGLRWFPCNKGGEFRKWYGNHEYVVNWQNDGAEIKRFVSERYPYLKGNIDYVIKDRGRFFNASVSWSDVTSAANSFRFYPDGFIYDATGHSAFCQSEKDRTILLGYANNCFVRTVIPVLNPTVHFHIGYFDLLPWPEKLEGDSVEPLVNRLVEISTQDWNQYELSWQFRTSPLCRDSFSLLKTSYISLRNTWFELVSEAQTLEEQNNTLFIVAYSLSDSLTAKVPEHEITLTCNPLYRYGENKGESELEALLLADTMREFISYAVGCMLGRYSLDAPGMILANQGDTVEDYRRIVAEKRAANGETREDLSFEPDEDNVIPILNGDWFPDDITERFKRFLKVTFGDDHFEENLRFLEDAIYPDNADAKTRKTVRDYFLKDFYSQHVKMYKKRPIYWLFSSPKGTFNALIYMHRYRPDTVSVVLKYLRDFQTKLQSHKQHLQSIADSADAKKADKTKALKEITQLTKDLKELEDYERKVIYPLASERREIDLDDGVKHNYPLFGEALKKIPGLDAKEDD